MYVLDIVCFFASICTDRILFCMYSGVVRRFIDIET